MKGKIMTNEAESQLILEETILGFLKIQLQKSVTEPVLLKALSDASKQGNSSLDGVDGEKLRYALAVLQTEGLILADTADDGSLSLKISRDGLRAVRTRNRALRDSVWVKENVKCNNNCCQ